MNVTITAEAGSSNEDNRGHATVEVAPDQQSLAIGRGGQNVRLAAKLTGWKIDISSAGNDKTEKDEEIAPAKEAVAEETAEISEEQKNDDTADESETEKTDAPENDKEAEEAGGSEEKADGKEK